MKWHVRISWRNRDGTLSPWDQVDVEAPDADAARFKVATTPPYLNRAVHDVYAWPAPQEEASADRA